MRLHRLTQREVAERVAADDERGAVGRAERVFDAARRTERRLLLAEGELHPRELRAFKMAGEPLGQVLQGEHALKDPVFREQLENVFHDGAAAQPRHRFGDVFRERAQARALSARHNDRFHQMGNPPYKQIYR